MLADGSFERGTEAAWHKGCCVHGEDGTCQDSTQEMLQELWKLSRERMHMRLKVVVMETAPALMGFCEI